MNRDFLVTVVVALAVFSGLNLYLVYRYADINDRLNQVNDELMELCGAKITGPGED